MMFEHLKGKMHEIMYDEWELKKWFKVGFYDFLNLTEQTNNNRREYYIFKAILDKNNPFRININLVVNLHIAKKSFDKEIIKHINFDCLPDNKIDLVMNICRKDKNHLLIKNVEIIKHKDIGDDILLYIKGID